MAQFENKEKHPSYGMISVSRVSGSGETSLFGSSIKHRNTIVLSIGTGMVSRELNTEWYFKDKEIIEVEMSLSQWADLISSMNIGNGNPCTIRWNGERIEECPYDSKRIKFEQELKETMNETNDDLNTAINSVIELLDSKKTVTKKDKEEILIALKSAQQNLNENTPFIYKQFNEQMDKTVQEAKGEVEAFTQNKIQSIALSAIAEKQNKFEELPPVVIDEVEQKEDSI